MKKIILSLFVLSLGFQSFAQTQEISQEEIEKRNWFHNDFSTTGIYGVGTDAALEFLKSKKMKPTPIVVGVLDSGVQIDHEDLKNEIWVNKKEKAGNGKDDDNNGYIDDIHGWDFCTDDQGKAYNEDSYEATRVVVLYENIFESADKAKNMENMRNRPAEYQTYLRAKKAWADKYYTALSQSNSGNSEATQVMEFLNDLADYAKETPLTADNIEKLAATTPEEMEQKAKLAFLVENNDEFKGLTMKEIIEMAKEEFGEMDADKNKDLLYAYNKKYDPTNGKLNIKGYGSNEVEGPDAFHGTHVAGIIGATRGNKLGIDGVAGGLVQIMSVRMVPDGDERDEDVANAIRYAVDNGAKILNMSFGKSFSPNKEMVYEAIQYADSKGVLMFHAAGNDNKDLDFNYNYPSNFMDNEMKPLTKNWITVGASTRYPEKLKASFSNFGTMKVDIFAPGTEIYSTIQGNSYRYAQGTSMASPVAAGCAALLWSYFPNLTSQQVKEILFETVNVSTVEVEVGKEKAPMNFDQISVTGGVIDVNKAVRLAYDRYGKKK
ncbi:MAG TPA: S8 family serine peptidase [Moheibacter sp.]|nr:S8 family serine peptidase [Moheibacter sp.]